MSNNNNTNSSSIGDVMEALVGIFILLAGMLVFAYGVLRFVGWGAL